MKSLKDFVVGEYDAATWRAIQEEAGLDGKIYVPVSEYDDEEAIALVGAASELSGEDEADLLYAFGRYIVEPLVQTYGVHVDREWSGLDLLANVETYIHEALRAKDLSEFTPPALQAKRIDGRTVVIRYGSDRELCKLAEGIIDGVGEHYGESYDIAHGTCQHVGDPHCDLVVRRTTLESAVS
ncbi:heme NO-binding domain-containing protein [Haloarchaeobius sp. HRN-SO-5]|uniref:heme NO-binding domain-containing protein n=1 Tax=Haloarchaeobius sp. HRN-SO-5 TaxID=3446118 RepID=UPI003EBD5959